MELTATGPGSESVCPGSRPACAVTAPVDESAADGRCRPRPRLWRAGPFRSSRRRGRSRERGLARGAAAGRRQREGRALLADDGRSDTSRPRTAGRLRRPRRSAIAISCVVGLATTASAPLDDQRQVGRPPPKAAPLSNTHWNVRPGSPMNAVFGHRAVEPEIDRDDRRRAMARSRAGIGASSGTARDERRKREPRHGGDDRAALRRARRGSTPTARPSYDRERGGGPQRTAAARFEPRAGRRSVQLVERHARQANGRIAARSGNIRASTRTNGGAAAAPATDSAPRPPAAPRAARAVAASGRVRSQASRPSRRHSVHRLAPSAARGRRRSTSPMRSAAARSRRPSAGHRKKPADQVHRRRQPGVQPAARPRRSTISMSSARLQRDVRRQRRSRRETRRSRDSSQTARAARCPRPRRSAGR